MNSVLTGIFIKKIIENIVQTIVMDNEIHKHIDTVKPVILTACIRRHPVYMKTCIFYTIHKHKFCHTCIYLIVIKISTCTANEY